MYRLRNRVENVIDICTVKMFSRQDETKWYEISISSTSFELISETYEMCDIDTLSNAKPMQTALIRHERRNSFL